MQGWCHPWQVLGAAAAADTNSGLVLLQQVASPFPLLAHTAATASVGSRTCGRAHHHTPAVQQHLHCLRLEVIQLEAEQRLQLIKADAAPRRLCC